MSLQGILNYLREDAPSVVHRTDRPAGILYQESARIGLKLQ